MGDRKTKERHFIFASARVILQEQQGVMERSRAHIPEADKPEEIHDLRVAIRRTRTLIRCLRSAMKPEVLRLEMPLRDLFLLLGQVRDADGALTAVTNSPDLKREVSPVLEHRRVEAKKRLDALLRGANVLDDVALLQEPLGAPGAPPADLSDWSLVSHARHQVLRSFQKLDKEWDLVEVHQLRKRIKRLRYLVEFAERQYGRPAKKFIQRLKKLQDQLGEIMDLVSLAQAFGDSESFSASARTQLKVRRDQWQRQIRKSRKKVLRLQDRVKGDAWRRLEKALTCAQPGS